MTLSVLKYLSKFSLGNAFLAILQRKVIKISISLDPSMVDPHVSLSYSIIYIGI